MLRPCCRAATSLSTTSITTSNAWSTGRCALEARDKKDLRFLLTALRVVPELERSHELAEHIARRAAYGLGAELTPRARGLIDRMGKVGMTMWRKAADCWYDKEGKAADELAQRDEEMDELQTVLVSEVAASGAPSSVAMELALVARFYERLGDHAVNVARMVCALHEDSDRQRGLGTRTGRR